MAKRHGIEDVGPMDDARLIAMENKRMRARLNTISEMAIEGFDASREAITKKSGSLGLVKPEIYELTV